jgi:hypothetical protein
MANNLNIVRSGSAAWATTLKSGYSLLPIAGMHNTY